MEDSLAAYVQWMGLRNLSDETVSSRVSILGGLAAFIGKLLIGADRDDLAAWQESLMLADTSRAQYISVVCCFYRWLVADGRLTVDPSRWLVAPKLPRRMPRPIDEDDLALALAAARPNVRCWLTLAAYAGLRGGEVAAMRREDVYDTSRPPVMIARGKGDRERIIPLAPPVLIALRPYLAITGPLFRRADGRPVDAAAVRRPCNDLLHELGIDSTMHKLRARFASQVYRASGRDLRMTQDLLGHTSPTTTSLYVAWSPDRAAEVVVTLGRRAG